MRYWKLATLTLSLLGLSAPTFAQRQAEYRRGPSVSYASERVSPGHRGVSLATRIGNFGLHFGHASSRRSSGYVSPRCPTPTRVYVKGHYETVQHKVWIPAAKQSVWYEPIYETRYDSCGRAYSVLVQAGHSAWVTTPGHYEYQPQRVWITGRWEYRS